MTQPSRRTTFAHTLHGRLVCVTDTGEVWRVGFKPEPWGWPDWQYAKDDHTFGNRWDDHAGHFRTIYAGSSLLGCLLEVLAHFRADEQLAQDMDTITEDPDDAAHYPTAKAGTVDHSWAQRRCPCSAHLVGTYASVTRTESVATLRSKFLTTAIGNLGLADLDAAALKEAKPRALTQRVATWLWEQYTDDRPLVDGVHFTSRHGDEHELWAVFERPDEDDQGVSALLSNRQTSNWSEHEAELAEAFRIHRLEWR